MTWVHAIRLSEVARGGSNAKLEPDAETRTAWAKTLGVESLPRLSASLALRSWLDGAQIAGKFEGEVEQVCGITLEPFTQPVSGEIELRVVPAGSPNSPIETSGAEVELDPAAPDPPEVLEGDSIDLAAYLYEYLALAIDPFPRKPGAVFEYKSPVQESSPFDVLSRLKGKAS